MQFTVNINIFLNHSPQNLSSIVLSVPLAHVKVATCAYHFEDLKVYALVQKEGNGITRYQRDLSPMLG